MIFQYFLLISFVKFESFSEVKDTLWEGGVRGAAFIWSPLLQKVSRVSHQMMNVEDWLPTIYSAAGNR